VRVSLRAVVDIRLTTDRTNHVAYIALPDDYFKMVMQTVATDVALATGRVQHLTSTRNTPASLTHIHGLEDQTQSPSVDVDAFAILTACCYLDLWPQNLIGSLVAASEYSLQVLSRLSSHEIAQDIWPDGRTNEQIVLEKTCGETRYAKSHVFWIKKR